MVHLLVQGLVDDGTVLQDDLGVLHIGGVQVGEGVLHPLLIVAVREVLVGVSSSRLLSGLGSVHLLGSLVDQVLQLQGLDQVGVPDHGAVLDADVLVLLHDLDNDILALLQVVGVAVDRGILLHADLELTSEVGGGEGALAVSDLVHTSDGGLAGLGRKLHRRAVRLHKLGGGVGCLSPEDDQVQQGIGTQSVGPMHRGAAGLACCQETRDDGALLVLDHLCLPIGGDASHVVVHGGQDGSGLLGHIDTGEDLGSLGDAGQSLGQGLRGQVVQVQVDVVLVGADTTTLADLQGHGSAHDIARGQVLGSGGISGHEGLTLTVSQDAALTTASLSEEAAGREDASRVELHELQVLHGQACSSGHGAAVASAGVGGGAGLVGSAEAASGDDGAVGAEAVDGAILHAHGDASQAPAIVAHDQVHGEVLHEEQAVELQGHAVQGVQNGVASSVGSGRASVGLATLAELQALTTEGALVDLAFRSSGEGQTEGLQLQDDLRGQSAHVLNGILIAQPIGTLHGVVGMPAPVVLGHVGQGTVDSTLGSHSVGSSGEDLGDAGGL
mmetsp:Transcript_69425/g.145005  ORF Transcript_69425/g.145005 Transcript_69425/m.145005 type:complete len:556 (-) Transcript_69425:101-1768(-)